MSGWMQSLRALARLKPTQKLTRDYLVSLLTAVLLALAVGAAIMLVCGHNPIEGYGALIEGALGKPRAIGNTLAKTVTLCLTGLAMSLAAKAGVFNVGGEGQLYLGAMAAAVVGAQLDAPAWLVTLLALLAAIVIRCIVVARNAKSQLDAYICVGVAGMLVFQIVSNVGMCLFVLPVVGLTLPFISYGGSSVVTLFIAMGMVSGIQKRSLPDWLR